MKRIFLFGLVFSLILEKDGFANCPDCPEKAIKREVSSEKTKEKEVKKGYSASASRLQKKVIRKEPAIASAKMPFPTPASNILKKEKELILPDGTLLKLIDPKDLKTRHPDLPPYP